MSDQEKPASNPEKKATDAPSSSPNTGSATTPMPAVPQHKPVTPPKAPQPPAQPPKVKPAQANRPVPPQPDRAPQQGSQNQGATTEPQATQRITPLPPSPGTPQPAPAAANRQGPVQPHGPVPPQGPVTGPGGRAGQGSPTGPNAPAGPGGPGARGGQDGPTGPGGPGGPTGPAAFGAAGGPDAQPQRKGRSAAFWPLIISAIVVVVLLAGLGVTAAVLSSVNKKNHGPDKVVAEYFQALSSGDIGRVRELAPFSLPENISDALLTNDAYLKNSASKISDVQVGQAQVDGDNARIEATYKLGDEDRKMTLQATKAGKEKFVFDKWRLKAPQLSVIQTALPDVKGMTLNGQAFQPEDGYANYVVFPGSYELKVPGGKYYDGVTQTSVAGFGTDEASPKPLKATLKANNTYTKDVRKAVSDKLTSCYSKHKWAPSGCPFFIDPKTKSSGKTLGKDAKEKDARWSGPKNPAVKATMSPNLTSGTFMTDSSQSFKFKAKSTKTKGATWRASADRRLVGTVKVASDKVTIEFSQANK
ncbi:hypothetical protein [Brevibacterium moorei]|uniref:hypothetical protein n=1 Tax=Brevibacterium moorei TaxID=2968457 RepID=UPI00211BC574|nr:hypothetical protein [Brevibacterium sp. 68QC2CO]MCQ9386848.1 hypothetical protein [Brevibacterium sp. 68QC2CO]